MKYQTFVAVRRTALAVIAVGAIGGGAWWWQRSSAANEKALAARVALEQEALAAKAAEQARRAALPSSPTPITASTTTSTSSLPTIDQDVLAVVAKTRVQEKVKDASAGKPYKINLYSDDGKRFTRAKVDLDRDEKWDESWTFGADGSTEKKVSDNDNDSYDRTLRLYDGKWSTVGLTASPVVASPTTTTTTAASALPAIDQDVIRMATTLPVQEKVKDASKGKAYKVNLYSDDSKRFNRAKVDLDRDEKWDESWTFGADGSTEKKVSTNDNDNYDRSYRLSNGQWTGG
jgi:hypothetical protein